jgi:hypothetical protein
MKRTLLNALIIVIGLCALAVPASGAPIIVPGYGETGWQTYSLTFNNDWRGTFGIGTSNYGDMEMDSRVLVSNLNIGPPGNTSFETGDFSGYTVYGVSNAVVSMALSNSGNIYTPTKGQNMASILSSYFYDESGWTYFEDTSEWGGTNGAYITFPLDVAGGTTLTFEWAFLAGDESPNNDFAFVFGQPKCGGPMPTLCEQSFGARPLFSDAVNCPEPYFEKIAEIGETVSVPEPLTLVLLVFGIIGIGVLRKSSEQTPSKFWLP